MENNNEFIDMYGYEGIYKINRQGDIYSCRYKKLLKPRINPMYGNLVIELTKNKIRKCYSIKKWLILNFDKTNEYYIYLKQEIDDTYNIID